MVGQGFNFFVDLQNSIGGGGIARTSGPSDLVTYQTVQNSERELMETASNLYLSVK